MPRCAECHDAACNEQKRLQADNRVGIGQQKAFPCRMCGRLSGLRRLPTVNREPILKTTMEVTFSQRIIAPDDVLVQMLDGEAVLLNLDTESYFGLDDVGARMWTLLTESDSIQAAYEGLLDEYDVTPEQLRADLIGLIDRLAEQGLIKLDADAAVE
jgi:Coenzyme PQQ synthesis protein D (PqqD)